MKKIFLLSLIALLGLAATGATIDFVVWQDKADKKGCNSLYQWASTNNKGEAQTDCYRIHTTQEADITQDDVTFEKYELDVNSAAGGIQVSKDDLFCIYIKDGETVTWAHYSGNTFPEQTGWFTQGGDADMKFGQTFFISKIYIYRNPTNNQLCIRFNNDAAPELPVVARGTSNYVLQVWDPETAQDNDALAWDNSGGLFHVWKGSADYNNGELYPISTEYLKEFTIAGDTYNYQTLCFRKVTDEEYAALKEMAGHPLKWASDDYDAYQAKVGAGNGFKRETAGTELYVIDFTDVRSGDANGGKGIYVGVPSLDDVKDGGLSSDEKSMNSLSRFFRGGIRFAFMNLDERFNLDKNSWADSHRFVKWGHVFRLNEVARPLNAFPVFHSDKFTSADDGSHPLAAGFADDFGPAEWNGFDYTPKEGNTDDFYGTDKAKTKDNCEPYNNKRGDSRLVAEYPFWLKRIYLEVAQAPDAINADGTPDDRYKHFYLSFEGEYDLSSLVSARSDWAYRTTTRANWVSEQPNIFHGAEIRLSDPAFQRFYNLDLSNTTNDTETAASDFLPALGCTASEYRSHTGQNNYLYLLDYTAGYTAKSEYVLKNAAGNPLAYASSSKKEGSLGADFEFTARSGKFYDAAGNQLYTTPGTGEFTTSVSNTALSLFFDPEQPDYTPAMATSTYTYTFPYQVNDNYTRTADYKIPYTYTQPSAPLSLTVEANWRSTDNTRFGSNLNWDNFISILPRSHANPFPLYTYSVSHAGSVSEDKPADSAFAVTEYSGYTLASTDNSYWYDHPEDKLIHNHEYTAPDGAHPTYWMHYNLDAWYNFSFVQNGIYSRDDLTDEAYSLTSPLSALTSNLSALTSNPSTLTTDEGLTFQIRPAKLTAYGKAYFDATITAIDAISSDAASAPAEYYNLQGVRVAAPEAGQVYIVRRGSAVTKELLR